MTGKKATGVGQSCPNCEFERRKAGKSVPIGEGVMRCTTCNTRWRASASPGAIGTRRKPADTRILKPATAIDSRVFATRPAVKQKRSANSNQNTSIPSRPAIAYHPPSPPSANPFLGISLRFYLMAALIPTAALMVSFGMAWLKPPAGPGLTLNQLTLKKMAGRQGLVATIGGKISNTSGKNQAAPDLQLVLLTKDGQKLRQWRYRPPVSTIARASSLSFETTIGNVSRSAERFEVVFVDPVNVAQR